MNLFSSCYFLSPWLFKVLDIISPFRLGPSGRTRSKQKTVEEFVEREREKGKSLIPSSFFYDISLLWLLFYCVSLFFLTDEQSSFFCSLS